MKRLDAWALVVAVVLAAGSAASADTKTDAEQSFETAKAMGVTVEQMRSVFAVDHPDNVQRCFALTAQNANGQNDPQIDAQLDALAVRLIQNGLAYDATVQPFRDGSDELTASVVAYQDGNYPASLVLSGAAATHFAQAGIALCAVLTEEWNVYTQLNAIEFSLELWLIMSGGGAYPMP